MTATIIVVTYNRPDCVQTCLERLRRQTRLPEQIIVVDGSPDNRTKAVCKQFPEVLYLRNEAGLGHMTRSRNIGLQQATGEIIAFIDDDSFAHPAWLEELLKPYGDPTVGGVGGRALRNQPDEDKQGVDQIGKLLPNGELTSNFAADPGRDLEVDHIIGCNMSWRKSVLEELGGLREIYPGTEVREETDIALRVSAAGYKLIFAHKAVVDHVGAPQAKGQRFDIRYQYYGQRNHIVLLVANFGFASTIFWRYILHSCFSSVRELLRTSYWAARRIAGGIAGIAANWCGFLVGLFVAIHLKREGKKHVTTAPRQLTETQTSNP
jgi:GT2 family glycosyltransferase